MVTKRDVCMMGIGAISMLGAIAIFIATRTLLLIDTDTPAFIEKVRSCTKTSPCPVFLNSEEIAVVAADGVTPIGTLPNTNPLHLVADKLGCERSPGITCTVVFDMSPRGWEVLELATSNGKRDYLLIDQDQLFAHSSHSR